MQSSTLSLIDALRTGDTSGANEAFARVMGEKVNAALDQEKVAVASKIYAPSQD